MSMVRYTIRVPQELRDDMERVVERGHYPSKSELVRAGIRAEIRDAAIVERQRRGTKRGRSR